MEAHQAVVELTGIAQRCIHEEDCEHHGEERRQEPARKFL
jgi:hypothetical protein